MLANWTLHSIDMKREDATGDDARAQVRTVVAARARAELAGVRSRMLLVEAQLRAIDLSREAADVLRRLGTAASADVERRARYVEEIASLAITDEVLDCIRPDATDDALVEIMEDAAYVVLDAPVVDVFSVQCYLHADAYKSVIASTVARALGRIENSFDGPDAIARRNLLTASLEEMAAQEKRLMRRARASKRRSRSAVHHNLESKAP